MSNVANWLAKLAALVETYGNARAAPGGTVAGANVAAAVALAEIVQHASEHPSSAPKPHRAGGGGEERPTQA